MALSNKYYKSVTPDKYNIGVKNQDNQQISASTEWRNLRVNNEWISRDMSVSNDFTTGTAFSPGQVWQSYSTIGANTVPTLLPSDQSVNSIHAMLAYSPSVPTVPIPRPAPTAASAEVTAIATATAVLETSAGNVTGADTINETGIRQTIRRKSCVLIPPDLELPHRPTNEKSPGCKTIFVGGLKENTTEDLLRDIFTACGEIRSMRISSKRYGHIQFHEETAVDEACKLSGYVVKSIDDESFLINRLHVNYVNAREDRKEWERKQRQLRREQRHREHQQAKCSDNIMSVGVPYTEHEANMVIDRLKNEDTFPDVIPVAVYWLDRGECTKRNTSVFYTMLQTCSSHVRRLMNDKRIYEDEFKKAKEKIKTKVHTILYQVGEIEKLLVSSSRKKVWDHFTKAQRRTIDSLKKHSLELKNWDLETSMTDESEMDLSDAEDDCPVPIKQAKGNSQEINYLKKENRNLHCQVEAFKNEVDVIRTEFQSEIDRKSSQIETLTESHKFLQEKYGKAVAETANLKLKLHEHERESDCLKIRNDQNTIFEEKTSKSSDSDRLQNENMVYDLSESDAKLLGLISIFLHTHPFGVSLDYICSYLQKFMPTLRTFTVEDLMNRFASLFQQDISGVGVNMEKRWTFIGFNRDPF